MCLNPPKFHLRREQPSKGTDPRVDDCDGKGLVNFDNIRSRFKIMGSNECFSRSIGQQFRAQSGVFICPTAGPCIPYIGDSIQNLVARELVYSLTDNWIQHMASFPWQYPNGGKVQVSASCIDYLTAACLLPLEDILVTFIYLITGCIFKGSNLSILEIIRGAKVREYVYFEPRGWSASWSSISLILILKQTTPPPMQLSITIVQVCHIGYIQASPCSLLSSQGQQQNQRYEYYILLSKSLEAHPSQSTCSV
jgi:hypothetical protein